MAVVVSHIADDFDALARAALQRAQVADLIEIRLDRIGNPGEAALRAFIEACPKPVIVTVHGEEAFGTFSGSIDERIDILSSAARAGAMFVDVDWTLSLVLGEMEGKCHRIVSRHDAHGTPADLSAFEADVREVLYEGDVIKLVTHATCTEDGLRMLRFLREARGGLVAFCSGEAGSFTRLLAPIFGSPFTFAAPAEGAPTAPGQLRVGDLLARMPPGGLSPETAIFGVVGRPIGHSLSPWVHGMALKAAHLDAVYVAFEPQCWETFVGLLADENFRGLSVTAPFKRGAFELATERDGASERVRAANTLVRDRDGWRASNTDMPAIREILERGLTVHAQRCGERQGPLRALVLGTGGAASAALGALESLSAELALAGRDAQRTAELAGAFRARALGWNEVGEFPYDLLVHCTPIGGEGRPDGEPRLPLAPEALRPETLVLDAVYRPLVTPLLELARSRGCTVLPGGEWFVRQAQAQFELFTHQAPDEQLMRASFEHALGLSGAPAPGGAP
ncbi:MAG: 3-dehydroquinate dehydratase/shikimate dehydrogenase [Gammaproteobacteria bacterium]|jgi:3-dehydroquinate dehydratase/shikimate dehydrogenase